MIRADSLGGIAAFVQAVQSGNFSSAAQRLHLSRSAVGKAVARLEEQLGVPLFQRTTRSQRLTLEGELFYQRCLRILAELEGAEDELAHGRQRPRGRLRLSMPVLLGRRCLAPILLELAERWPELQFELSFNDRKVDLLEEGVDLAIRSGPLDDTPGLRARRLGEDLMVVCAAPAWLARQGTPLTLDALAIQPAVLYSRGAEGASWVFEEASGRLREVRPPARLLLDDLDAMLLAACRGLGVTRLPNWLVDTALREGRLVALNFAEQARPIVIQAVWPDTRQLPFRVRLVLDELVERLPPVLAATSIRP
jgi:DNA-binding transcriptional LysR family regulator